jgi:hypothetical protein
LGGREVQEMIIVTIELLSAITGRRSTLGVARISNDGLASAANPNRGDYDVEVLRKGADPLRVDAPVTRRSRVTNYARAARPVWDLVTLALKEAGYGR